MNIEEFKTLKIHCTFCNQANNNIYLYVTKTGTNYTYYCLGCNEYIIYAYFINEIINSCKICLSYSSNFIYNITYCDNYIEVDKNTIINFLRNFDVKLLKEKYKALELFK